LGGVGGGVDVGVGVGAVVEVAGGLVGLTVLRGGAGCSAVELTVLRGGAGCSAVELTVLRGGLGCSAVGLGEGWVRVAGAWVSAGVFGIGAGVDAA